MRRNFTPTVEKMLGQILVERNIISPGSKVQGNRKDCCRLKEQGTGES